MIQNKLAFGYYPLPLDVIAGPVTISSIANLLETVAEVENSDGVYGDWIYAPPQEVRHLGGGFSVRPYPSRIFGLPKTHTITHASPDNPDQIVFHIWALSFFQGIRLTATEAGFIDSTPIKPGKLVDFVLLAQGLEKSIDLTESFWITNRNEPQHHRIMAAAIHALFLAQNPQHLQFEQFIMLYTAFDACFALAKSLYKPTGRITHAKRVEWMCGQFGMPVPAWAESATLSWPEIASMRNEAVHEALFMGEPLGFALHGVGTNQNLPLEMEAFICRLLVALIGAPHADYVRSPITTRQRQGLNFV